MIDTSKKPEYVVIVIGKKGSGKSTMCLCLFRIIEANSGSISRILFAI